MIVLRNKVFSKKSKTSKTDSKPTTGSSKINGKDYINGNFPDDYERGGNPKSVGEVIREVSKRGKRLSEN